jgi:thioredoxin-like negative regulator of GroEL
MSAPRPRFGDAELAPIKTHALGAAVLFVPFFAIGFLLCLMYGVPGLLKIPISVAFAAVLATAAMFVASRFAGGAGQVIARIVAPSGSTTPYEHTFSYQQSLAVKGDVAGALESYEAVIAASPHNVEAHVQAAELYATSGNAVRAIELFRATRAFPAVTATREIYVSNRLIDLYLGAAADDGRVLVELRRLIERYPDSDTARRAREALGRLKSQRVAHA